MEYDGLYIKITSDGTMTKRIIFWRVSTQTTGYHNQG